MRSIVMYKLYNIHKQVKRGCSTYTIYMLVGAASVDAVALTNTNTNNKHVIMYARRYPVNGGALATIFFLFYNRSSKAYV